MTLIGDSFGHCAYLVRVSLKISAEAAGAGMTAVSSHVLTLRENLSVNRANSEDVEKTDR